jgi:eukaryotic-like serine/threonine-protein kinase
VKSPTIENTSRWIGRILRDKWRIDARIARGGVGTVWAATHKNNGNHVALKVLHPEFSRDADTRSRFLQEGYAANQVNHPGVVRILDDDMTEEGLAFLVMELLEGELLERRRMRKGGRLPLAEVYELGDQLLDVLAAAHDKGIVHRDVKPDNLFITNEGKLKVLDFGFAQMKTGFRKEQTATGFLLGTPGFMSPEQAVGNRAQVDAQTDIWAVGATLFTCLSAKPVHEGESAAEMLVAAANFPARSLASVERGLPPKLVEIVDRALLFDKSKRWANARAMQNALRSIPGRQALGGRLDSGQRSVPDGRERQPAGPPSSERTVMEEVQQVEELDESALQDANPSWNERTVMADAGRPIPKDALPSVRGGAMVASRAVHPADQEASTLAIESPADKEPMTRAPLTPQIHTARPHMQSGQHGVGHAGYASGMVPSGGVPPSNDSGTLIMESPAHMSSGGFQAGQQASQTSGPPTQPFRQPSYPNLSQPPVPPTNDPRASRADDMMFVAGPARPAPPRQQGGKRVLVFIAVAAISMVIVIVTGLLVIAASD